VAHKDHPITDYRSAVGSNGQLIDVREPKEVAAGTIDGAKNIPLGQLPDRLSELASDRRVVVLCRSGGRSTKAAEFLTASGFSDVVNLEGGMLAYEKG
jgi:rhodanese-related sulfurtransferase